MGGHKQDDRHRAVDGRLVVPDFEERDRERKRDVEEGQAEEVDRGIGGGATRIISAEDAAERGQGRKQGQSRHDGDRERAKEGAGREQRR